MGGEIGFRFLVRSALLALAWAPEAAAQTSATPASGRPPPPSVAPPPAPAAPAASATAAFPAAAPTAPPPVSASAAPASSPAPAAAPARRVAVVRFAADERGALLESDSTADGRNVPWYVVCEAPCTRAVSTSGSFRVGGYGFHSSRLFRLPEDRNEIAINAEMERSSIALPMAVTIVGGVIAGVGGSMLLGGLAAEEQHRDGEDLIVTGSIVSGAGLFVATVGVILLLVNAEHDESRAHVAESASGLTF
jgi:hypothetical protein